MKYFRAKDFMKFYIGTVTDNKIFYPKSYRYACLYIIWTKYLSHSLWKT